MVWEESEAHRRMPVNIMGWLDAFSQFALNSDESKSPTNSVPLLLPGNLSPGVSESMKICHFRGAGAQDFDAIYENMSAHHFDYEGG